MTGGGFCPLDFLVAVSTGFWLNLPDFVVIFFKNIVLVGSVFLVSRYVLLIDVGNSVMVDSLLRNKYTTGKSLCQPKVLGK